MPVAKVASQPRLGDTSAQFVQDLGLPKRVRLVAHGVLRTYAGPSGMLSVLFMQGRAAAIHHAFPCVVPDDDVAAWRADRRVLIGASGIIVAEPSLPLGCVSVLDREAALS
jgi:hypothetical protein